MSNEEYISCIVKMLKNLDNTRLERIFNYVHRIFLLSARG